MGSPSAAADDALASTVIGSAAAHQRLFTTLDRLDDGGCRRPSRLPGWTIGHVLTHLARNADSHVRMLEGAGRGEALEQYPGGYDQRAADIEAGAGRPAAALAHDVRSSAARLELTWARTGPRAWAGHGLARGRRWACRDLPFHRWREVELHHVDLGLGYEPTHWPEEYVARELPIALAALPERLPAAARAPFLAWLMGRTAEPGPLALDEWQSRPERYFTPTDLP